MRLTQYGISDKIRFIQRGWVSSNSVLVLGDGVAGPCLIDTGHHGMVDELVGLVEAEGVRAADLVRLVNTHGHWDHWSGNEQLRVLSGAEVVMGETTARWMRDREMRELWLTYFGVKAELSRADVTVSDGDVIALGGMDWQAVALPGHAPDLLGYYQADEKVLVCADALMGHGDCGVLNVMVHGWEALDAALGSVERMLEMDIRVALPGHTGVIVEVERNLLALRRRLLGFKEKPLRLVRHFVRRILMAALLEMPPVSKRGALDAVLGLPWVADYEPLMGGVSAETMLSKTIDELVLGKALRVEDGVLVCQVPR